MVKVNGNALLNDATKTALVSLFADNKSDYTGLSTDDIVGYPKGYDIEWGSKALTAKGDIAYMQSDGSWNWL